MRLKYLAVAVAVAAPLVAEAGAVIKIDDEAKLDVGLRLQTQYVVTEKDRDGDGKFENQSDFNIRRGRLRFKADVTKWMRAFIQTEFEDQTATSPDNRVIDAYIQLKPHKLANLYMGVNMSPAMRQEVSSSAGHLALDRPGLAYKSLTWGGRTKYAFTNTTYGDSNSRLVGNSGVRDKGATLFGSTSLSDTVHFKYYAGVYDGVQNAREDENRYTLRAQMNFFDSEPGYYNNATYQGKKKTIGIGASYDTQDAVALDQTSGRAVDYRLYSLDAFTEWPLGGGALTAELGYVNLDLDGGGVMVKADGTTLGNASQAQGDGWFVQTGYYFDKWQPWVAYEEWKSDAADGLGGFKAYRAGLNYYMKGTNANVKAGYEVFKPDVRFTASEKDIRSFVVSLNFDF